VKKYLISQIIAIIISGSTFCNTILIDPSGAGSFKLGSTFESNGWKVLNFQNLNGWAIGSQFGANKAAFASPNWNSANPVPGINTNDLDKAFHLYYEIELPEDEDILEISFKFRMDRGRFSIGVAPIDYTMGNTNLQVPGSIGYILFSANYTNSSQAADWTTVKSAVHTSFAGKRVRLIITGSYATILSPPLSALGPLVSEISLISRSSITYQSLPGTYIWNNPNAWLPQGIPGVGDNAIITSASSITGDPINSLRNLTVEGSLTSNVYRIIGNLLISSGGHFSPQTNTLFIKGNFTVQEGGFVDGRLTNFAFSRTSLDSTLKQYFSFHSPNQFHSNVIRGLTMGNSEGLQVNCINGRLAVCSLLQVAGGKLDANDALEINHAALPNVSYTRISFFDSSTWTTPIFRANGSRIGLQYNGISGSPQSPYIMGSQGEVSSGDTLYEFTVGNVLFFLKCPFDLIVGTKIASNFNLFGSLIMEKGKSVIFTDNAFGGCTPFGFPGTNTFNIFNNGHVQGGVSFRLNGLNLTRVWPVGISGQQFVLGMYGINANNALVRVSVLKADSGVAGQGVSFIHPLYRYRVELLEGTIEKVDSINLGYNSMLSGFSGSDFQNRRIVKSLSIGGSYEEIGGPAGRQVFPNSARPDFNFGWVRSNLGNYNAPSYYAFGLSNGSFSSIWINKPGSNMLWNDPSNWSGNVVPTAFDRVIIDAPGATIIVDQNSACLQLTLSNGTKLDIPPGIKFSVGG
jgi:hypothetical protein